MLVKWSHLQNGWKNVEKITRITMHSNIQALVSFTQSLCIIARSPATLIIIAISVFVLVFKIPKCFDKICLEFLAVSCTSNQLKGYPLLYNANIYLKLGKLSFQKVLVWLKKLFTDIELWEIGWLKDFFTNLKEV